MKNLQMTVKTDFKIGYRNFDPIQEISRQSYGNFKNVVYRAAWYIILPCVSLIFPHKLVFGDKQNLHSLHCGMYNGMTWSPFLKAVTPSPTLSTIPPPS